MAVPCEPSIAAGLYVVVHSLPTLPADSIILLGLSARGKDARMALQKDFGQQNRITPMRCGKNARRQRALSRIAAGSGFAGHALRP